ncbi:hypothetical protein R1flu_020553 [Riccia fluitans]|uniref:Uncharacterized protein n=1 Tax=Riccia fluitans TaxID=41844 RepID=A0ABD1ZLU4_9MARC
MLWWDHAIWYMFNHLSDFFPQSTVHGRYMAFLIFLGGEARPAVLAHLSFLHARKLMLDTAMEVFANPKARTLPEHGDSYGIRLIERMMKPASFSDELISREIQNGNKKRSRPAGLPNLNGAPTPMVPIGRGQRFREIGSDTEDEPDRQLHLLPTGRTMLCRNKKRKGISFIHLLYWNRAFEWISTLRLLADGLSCIDFPDIQEALDEITIGWRYLPVMSNTCYNPFETFINFSFDDHSALNDKCACLLPSYKSFLDPLTLHESHDDCPVFSHVRTMSIDLVKNLGLRKTLNHGLNHIPTQPTRLAPIVEQVLIAWDQFCFMLYIDPERSLKGRRFVREKTWDLLKSAASENRSGLKQSKPCILRDDRVWNEINWLKQNFFIADLDKASNNICFICQKHLRRQTLKQLQGGEFFPGMHNGRWTPPEALRSWLPSYAMPQLKAFAEKLRYDRKA